MTIQIKIPPDFLYATLNYSSLDSEKREISFRYISHLLENNWEDLIDYAVSGLSQQPNVVSAQQRFMCASCLKHALTSSSKIQEEILFQNWNNISINHRNYIKGMILYNLSFPEMNTRHLLAEVVGLICKIEESNLLSVINQLYIMAENVIQDQNAAEGAIFALKEIFIKVNFKNISSFSNFSSIPQLIPQFLQVLFILSGPGSPELQYPLAFRKLSIETASEIIHTIPLTLQMINLNDFVSNIIKSLPSADIHLYIPLFNLLTYSMQPLYQNLSYIQQIMAYICYGISITTGSFLVETIKALIDFIEYENSLSCDQEFLCSKGIIFHLVESTADKLGELLIPLLLQCSKSDYDLNDPNNETPMAYSYRALSMIFISNPPVIFEMLTKFIKNQIFGPQWNQVYAALAGILCLCESRDNAQLAKQDKNIHEFLNSILMSVISISRTEFQPIRFISLCVLSIIIEICPEIPQIESNFGEILESVLKDFQISSECNLQIQCKIIFNLAMYGNQKSIDSTFDLVASSLNQRGESDSEIFCIKDIYEALSIFYLHCSTFHDETLKNILFRLTESIQKPLSINRLCGLVSNIGQICSHLGTEIIPIIENVVRALIGALSLNDSDLIDEIFISLSIIFRIQKNVISHPIFNEDGTKVNVSNPILYLSFLEKPIINALKSGQHFLMKQAAILLEIIINPKDDYCRIREGILFQEINEIIQIPLNNVLELGKFDPILVRALSTVISISSEKVLNLIQILGSIINLECTVSCEDSIVSILSSFYIQLKTISDQSAELKKLGTLMLSYLNNIHKKGIYSDQILHYSLLNIYELSTKCGTFFNSDLNKKFIKDFLDFGCCSSIQTISCNANIISNIIKSL